MKLAPSLLLLLVAPTLTSGFVIVPPATSSITPPSTSKSKVILSAGGPPTPSSSDTASASSTSSSGTGAGKVKRARELIKSLVEEEECFSTEQGAKKFGEACAMDVLYEDCYEPQPFVGRVDVTNHMIAKVQQRQNRGKLRIDRITDGDVACGFAWTYTTSTEEGLRGTTFVELNPSTGEIQYIREIPEPIYKPGDLTIELLKAVTEGATPKPTPEYETKTPQTANGIAQYLFKEVQGSSIDESMRFFDERIIYRDFNYDEVMKGKDEVRTFIEDFSFPGITFVPTRFDDGVQSTCFTWEVALEGADDTIKGISLYEMDEETKQITYVRDVPESAIKPPILGKLARLLRPGLGVFQGVPIGSREGGM